ncbi:hypothetical protein KBX71_12090 [Micromonospora sp. D93]|uniref:hypothetical protein n=1 Tax=Micromonospora sp. D93 TaxID=2824886 RepID=UPI001B376513|nr:hypothetical protein [Micromonospora sp. D93]MBQ1018597.1 hypothetical protein [Micromonospora sp. D93]
MLAAEAPKITDWMQAWGSLAGLVMSTFAVIFTGLLFRHEIRVRREEQRDNEAALARLVVAEYLTMSTTGVDVNGYLVGDLTYVEYRIRNVSPSPILNVFLAVRDRRDDKLYRTTEVRSVVVTQADMGVTLKPPLSRPKLGDPTFLIPVIIFTDANGLSWVREGTAGPKRILRGKSTSGSYP